MDPGSPPHHSILRTFIRVFFIISPRRRRFGSEFCKRQIELQRASGKGVHLRLLRRVKAVGGPDQCSKHEREQ